MSTPAEQLLKKMGEDKAFAETILKQNEIEKVIELAEEEGIALTQEDIDEANAIIQKIVEMQNNSQGELTEEELENVAGGGLVLCTMSIMAFVAACFASASAVVSGSVTATVTYSVIASASANFE
jgi:predicted ribosomally synthesized peptide with nif11-like leader